MGMHPFPKPLLEFNRSQIEALVKMDQRVPAGSFIIRKTDARQITVPATTVDVIVSELGLPRVDFIKADIKGATTQMLAGAVQTVRRFRPRMALATEEPGEDPFSITDVARKLNPSYDPSYELSRGRNPSVTKRPIAGTCVRQAETR
jgi:hypothetical protein